MADRVLISTNDLDNAGAVAAADVIYFADGSIACTQNVDNNGLAAGGIDSCFVAAAWTGDIGTAGAPLIMEISSAGDSIFEYAAGGGRCWYEPRGSASVCDKLRVLNRGEMNLVASGTVVILECMSATTNLFAPVAATTLRVGGTGLCTVLDAASTDPTLVEVWGSGQLITDRGATAITQWGGSINMKNANENTVGTWTLYNGSALLKRCGTITTFNWFGGTLDTFRTQAPVTITTLNYVSGNVDKAALDYLLSGRNRLVTIGSAIPVGGMK